MSSLGSQASTDHVQEVAREGSLSARGLKSHRRREWGQRHIYDPPPGTDSERSWWCINIIRREKYATVVYTKNSDPVLVTNINKLIYLLYVLFPSLSSLPSCTLPFWFLLSKTCIWIFIFSSLECSLLVQWITEKHPGKTNWLPFIVFSQAIWAQALLISKFM